MQYEQIKELIAIFEKTDLNDMEVQLDNAVLRLNRGAVSPFTHTGSTDTQTQGTVATQPVVLTSQTAASGETVEENISSTVPTADESEKQGDKVIKSPIVGTFYQSASPDEEPFVKIGDTIAKGDVVCIIEAMKFMNEVNSEVSGTITEILVNDGDFGEYGQALFRVR